MNLEDFTLERHIDISIGWDGLYIDIGKPYDYGKPRAITVMVNGEAITYRRVTTALTYTRRAQEIEFVAPDGASLTVEVRLSRWYEGLWAWLTGLFA